MPPLSFPNFPKLLLDQPGADRAKTPATFREILDAMWLFDDKFEQALAQFDQVKARQKG